MIERRRQMAVATARRLRSLQMRFDEHRPRRRGRMRVFNLDLHVSVVRDLAGAFEQADADLIRWSISGHNHLIRRVLGVADPVEEVNARTWSSLDENMIDRFQDRYRRLLLSCDAFLITHTPAFAQLFGGLDRPALVVASTRYEAPFTDKPSEWRKLDTFIRHETSAGRMRLVANNRADADYLAYFTGLVVPVVPSVCDYLAPRRTSGNGQSVILGRPGTALDDLMQRNDRPWRTVADAYGSPYRWRDLVESDEVLILPYNVSTMSLFELATAGVPAAVPDRRMLKALALSDPSVLAELSYAQMRGLSTNTMNPGDPNNYDSPGFLDWWLDRADFYDPVLMPNVRAISDDPDSTPSERGGTRVVPAEALRERNDHLRHLRARLVSDFLDEAR